MLVLAVAALGVAGSSLIAVSSAINNHICCCATVHIVFLIEAFVLLFIVPFIVLLQYGDTAI